MLRVTEGDTNPIPNPNRNPNPNPNPNPLCLPLRLCSMMSDFKVHIPDESCLHEFCVIFKGPPESKCRRDPRPL